jgi:hypothetical protein
MSRPDLIVLVINFERADKSKTQVSSKKFILGEPSKGKRGDLEDRVTEILGTRTIACYKFSLIKYPISRASRAKGAVGLFRFIGSTEDLERTLRAMNDVCKEAKDESKYKRNWEFEIYTATRWSP